VRADEKLTAFIELEAGVRKCTELACQGSEIFCKISRNRGLDPGERASPDSFFPSFRPAVAELTNRENGKVDSYESTNI